VLEILEEETVTSEFPPSGSFSQVTVKVLDATGTVVFQKQVSMNEMLREVHGQTYLPQGSLFVYYSHHTVYYFIEKQAVLGSLTQK
jgi:hypothetical protein